MAPPGVVEHVLLRNHCILPLGGTEEGNTPMSKAQKVIKWRVAAPIAKAAVTAGTVVALISSTGANLKWW